MSKAPSMPMYWDAYIADTTHLTTEEHGAYLLLLGAMWRRNGWVPDDDRDNARILGMTTGKWRKIKSRLSVFLVFENGEISQKKLQEIWGNTQEKIQKNRVNGAKGGRPKSSESNGLAKANGYISDNPNKTIPEPEPVREDTNVSSAPSAPKKRATRLSQDWVLPKEWGQWALSESWPESVIRVEAEKFRDYWIGVGGAKGAKLDWQATWRNWMRNSKTTPFTAINGGSHGQPASKSKTRMDAFIRGAGSA